jgi:hypothetical protein
MSICKGGEGIWLTKRRKTKKPRRQGRKTSQPAAPFEDFPLQAFRRMGRQTKLEKRDKKICDRRWKYG